MESMALGRTYRSIYLAGPTFNLLTDDDAAQRALARIRDHLDEGGSALGPLFIPRPGAVGAVGVTREAREPDGSVIRFTTVSQRTDEEARLQTSLLRYERVGDEIVEREWVLHWHTQDGFRALAEAVDLQVAAVLDPTGAPAAADAEMFVFWLTR